MSHTIVRETSNEAGKKILRGKSLNSRVGIFNGQSLNSLRNSFVGASGGWGGGGRKARASDWDGLRQCQLWSGQPAQTMTEYEGSWEKKGRRGHQNREWLEEDVLEPWSLLLHVLLEKMCAGQPLCFRSLSIGSPAGPSLLTLQSAVHSAHGLAFGLQVQKRSTLCIWCSILSSVCWRTNLQSIRLFLFEILCTLVNSLQFIPCVSATEAWECSGFNFNYTLKQLISPTSSCLMLIRE